MVEVVIVYSTITLKFIRNINTMFRSKYIRYNVPTLELVVILETAKDVSVKT